MTTNAGSEASSSISGFSYAKETRASEKTERALAGFLRPEFINRVDEIITFRHLSKTDFESIANIMLSKLSDAMKEKGIRLTFDDEVLTNIAEKSYSEKYGARNMRRYISREIEDVAADKIISGYANTITEITIDVADDAFVIDVK